MDEFDSPDGEPDPITAAYRAAVVRVQRLLHSAWDPDDNVAGDPEPDPYKVDAEHVASLVWMGETPDFIADYLASGGMTGARLRLGRADLVSLARAAIRLASAPRSSA